MFKMQAFGIMIYLRSPSVKSCNTDSEAPKNGSLERPFYDKDLRTPDTIVVRFRLQVEVLTLFGCHVAFCEAIDFGALEVDCYDLRNEKRVLHLYFSVSSHHNANGAFRWFCLPEASTYTCEWHQIFIHLRVGWSSTSPLYADPDKDGE